MKLIITADPEHFILAVRAAQWLLNHPEHRDTMIEFERGEAFYVRRTKTGIFVRHQGNNRDRSAMQTAPLAPPP